MSKIQSLQIKNDTLPQYYDIFDTIIFYFIKIKKNGYLIRKEKKIKIEFQKYKN